MCVYVCVCVCVCVCTCELVMFLFNYSCRNLFNWFSLVFFFYNGLAGLVTAVIRIGLSAALGLLLLFRLDEVALMKCFAFLDAGKFFSNKEIINWCPPSLHAGHKSFLGFFYLHYAYNNAVVHVFMKILKESIHDDPSTPMDSPVYEEEGSLGKGILTTSSKHACTI